MTRTHRGAVFLLSDFGLRDAYVGVMKAIVAGLAPGAPQVDLVHELPPQDLIAAQLQLEACLPYVPHGSVLLAVVDPGVGGDRRGVAVEVALPVEQAVDDAGPRAATRGDAGPGGPAGAGQERVRAMWAVAPDNGLLTPLLEAGSVRTAVALRRGAVRPQGPGTTFDGRDLFAPAAGALASGMTPTRLGDTVDPAGLRHLPLPHPRRADRGWLGEVVYVDRFGNLVTNLRPHHLPDGAASVIEVAGHELHGVRAAFAEVAVGAPVVYVGSLGRVEVALREGDAATSWGLGRGAPVRATVAR